MNSTTTTHTHTRPTPLPMQAQTQPAKVPALPFTEDAAMGGVQTPRTGQLDVGHDEGRLRIGRTPRPTGNPPP